MGVFSCVTRKVELMNRLTEYLYIDFGDGPRVTASPALNIVSGKLTDNMVRAGINDKFY
jgi:hypothetical protein